MTGGKIMERVYICKNGVREKTRYWVGANARARGKRKKGNTSYRKQEANHRTAVKQLARIFNCNLDHSGYLLELTWDEANYGDLMQQAGNDMDRAKALADKKAMLWLRRVKRNFNLGFFWLGTSDIDGNTGEVVRLHSHVVLMGEISMDKLQELWKLGNVNFKHLRRQPDYTPLAVYLLNQMRKEEDKKRYHISRGYARPDTDEREVLCNSEIKAPPGAMVFEHNYRQETVSQYIRYLPKKRETKNELTVKNAADWDPGEPGKRG